ncbi:MAG: hypothetical protein D6782_03155, partial [Alphaproteobacteria bacterium]
MRRIYSACLAVLLASAVGLGAATASKAADQAPSPDIGAAEYYIHERMLVKPDKLDWFADYYRRNVLPVLALADGYLGTVISTTLPLANEDFGPVLPLGPPAETFLPHDGIKLRDTLTNTQIHFDSLLRGTFRVRTHNERGHGAGDFSAGPEASEANMGEYSTSERRRPTPKAPRPADGARRAIRFVAAVCRGARPRLHRCFCRLIAPGATMGLF